MTPTGQTLLAGAWLDGTGPAFRAVDPATGAELDGTFCDSGPEQVDAAARAAAEAATAYRGLPRQRRALLLETAADGLEAAAEVLLARVVAESGLPHVRVTGELARTAGQLRLFAAVAREGEFLGRRHDPALPQRTPLPRPDLRLLHVPLGPVAVFGASNFPLAFSVAGGDTASALAAGCPVIAKAHPAHPGVSEIVAGVLAAAVRAAGAPEGTFSMVHGGVEIGTRLVSHPAVAAVGFTGSRRGGLALQEAARSRAVPIPVFAEMSSVNPVVVLPGALADPDAVAQGYAGSLTKEAGQYCTNPGLLFLPDGRAGDAVVAAVASRLSKVPGQVMLTASIAQACTEGAQRWRTLEGVREETAGGSLVPPGAAATTGSVEPALFATSLEVFAARPELAEEVFGPVGLVVRYPSLAALLPVLTGIEGQLTATVHATSQDHDAARQLLPVLEGRAGRVVWNGWPTGVEVASAMVHGGPWPATTVPASTSVGTLAIARFLRPVSYQDVPTELLPAELR